MIFVAELARHYGETELFSTVLILNAQISALRILVSYAIKRILL